MRTVRWKMGVEVELLAPRGASRRTLAQAVARAEGGRVEPVFHRDAEPTTLEGTSHFFNLTHGFEVRRGRQVLFRFVDDVTLQRELDRAASPRHGWYRVLSDDLRLLNLALRRCDPRAAQSRVLQPLAQLFGTRATHSERMWRVADETGAPAYLACPLPGERERGCEVITAPLSRDHEARLEAMLTVARRLRFVAPHEGAVH